ENVRFIIAQFIFENVEIRKQLRKLFNRFGTLKTKGSSKVKFSKNNIQDIIDESFSLQSVAGPKYMAIRRAERQKYISSEIEIDDNQILGDLTKKIIQTKDPVILFQLEAIISDVYYRLLKPAFQSEVKNRLWEQTQDQILITLTNNLQQNLMYAPMGYEIVLAIYSDAKDLSGAAVVIDKNGKLLDGGIVQFAAEQATVTNELIASLIQKHNPKVIAINKGDSYKKIKTALKSATETSETAIVGVDALEAKAFANSDLAIVEAPQTNEIIRSAVYVGQKLQNPLSAMVKVDPIKLNMGAYQQEVDQQLLAKKARQIIELTVNRVGANVNLCTVSYLQNIAGLNEQLARNIFQHVLDKGPLKNREELKNIEGMDDQNFEQSAGFLMIPESDVLLDQCFVHPNNYSIVKELALASKKDLNDFLNDRDALRRIDIKKLQADCGKELLAKDLYYELQRKYRDPRPPFKVINFDPSIKEIKDIKVGQIITCRVSHFANFGVFVDIGLDQDALVHSSQMPSKIAAHFTRHFNLGQSVQVKVKAVDLEKNRLQLELYFPPKIPAKQTRTYNADTKRNNSNRGSSGKKSFKSKRPFNKHGKPKTRFGTLGDQFKDIFPAKK
ncbi:hypothetical protein BVY03_05760, partial [bacterium K02(2017)]